MLTSIITTSVLIVTLLAPFFALRAVSFAKKKNYQKHIQIQKRTFWTCIVAVLVLELQIRFGGGSGSLVKDSNFLHTAFFKYTLIFHIIGAVLTYVIWGITLFLANKKFKKRQTLPGKFSNIHKILGYMTIIGLLYTAITALMVYMMAFVM